MLTMNKMIDHTLLKADASQEQIITLCQEAREYQFASVCIQPHWIPLAKEQLRGTKVKVCTVIGFPLGANSTETKAFETRNAIAMGADEVDMVINISHLKAGNIDYIQSEIAQVVQASAGVLVKVILETCLLTSEEVKQACKASVAAGAHFVKTSTGFSTGGATVEVVQLMKATVGQQCQVKASGGVRSLEDAQIMVRAGASRIGTSAGVAIMQGLTADSAY